LEPTSAVQVEIGPVRVRSQREVCWNLRAEENGYHRLVFQVGEQTVEKDLAIGDGMMRVSAQRPALRWLDVLEHPSEPAFAPDAPVQSIVIDYPKRASWTSGADKWVYYWFAVSFIAALCFRRLFNVNI
jgi:hypothetical protein